MTTIPNSGQARAIEWPTLVLALVIYGGWLALTAWHASVPLPLLVVGGAILIAWQGSLQHEVIHGHPTGIRWIDDAIGFPPLSLWLPYRSYRKSHIAHHATPHLTDPFDDSESNYRAAPGGLGMWLCAAEAPLIGRLVLGPPIRVLRYWFEEARLAWRDPIEAARDWLPHLAGVALVLWWLDHVGLSLPTYILAFVYPGTALSLIRSFAEHRANADPAARSAIVERGGPFALLYLYNNLHSVHHLRPALPWYRIRREYWREPALYRTGPFYRSYATIFARFLFRPQDRLLHPSPRPRDGYNG